MKRLLPDKLESPTSPLSVAFFDKSKNRKSETSRASSTSGGTLSITGDYVDYPLGNRKATSPTKRKYAEAKNRAAQKSPKRLLPQSITMNSILSNSSLDYTKLSPKFKKETVENAYATKVKKQANDLVESDDIDGLKELIKNANLQSSDLPFSDSKEKLTFESSIFNDSKTNMNLLHEALEYEKYNTATYLIENSSFDYLLQTYTNIDSQIPPSCKSCLHILAEKGNKELLDMFLVKLRTKFPKVTTTYQAIIGPFTKGLQEDKVSSYINMKVVVKTFEGKRRLTSVHLAVLNGHPHILQLMKNHEFDMDVNDDYNETPLMWAIKKKNFDAFKELLKLGVDVNKINIYNCSPLHLTITSNQMEMAEILIDIPETDLNQERIKNPRWVIENVAYHNYHPLMKKLMSPSIKKKINPENIKEALFIAAKEGFPETVKEILEEDISLVNVTDDFGNTPVLIAADNNKVEVVRLLVETYYADISVKNNLLETIYDMAMRQSTSDILEYFMQQSKSDQMVQPMYLHTAAAAGDLDKINFILDFDKIKLLELDSNNNTIFHTAATNNAHNVLSHFLKKDDDFTDLQNKEGETALLLAIKKGHVESFKILLEKNARIDLEDNSLQNALHAAVATVTTNYDIVSELVGKMKQTCFPLLNSQDCNGNTALHLAAKYSKNFILEIFSDLDPEVENSDGETALHVAVLHGTIREVKTLLELFYINKKAQIDHRDESGHTALFRSAEKGDSEIFEVLLSHGADITLRNNEGCTLLHRIVEINQKNLTHSDQYIGIVYSLIKWSVKWYCRKQGQRCPIENTNQYYIVQLEAVRYLTNDLYFKGCNFLQYASKLETGDLLIAVLRTPNVYKFTIESPLKFHNVNSQQSKNNTASILSKYLQEKKSPNEVLYDVTYLIPANRPFEKEPIGLELSTKTGNRLTQNSDINRPPSGMISCLENIVHTNNENFINQVLDDEPFRFLVSKYWTLCRRGYEILMWIHVSYMILFTYFIMPSKEYLHYRFNQMIQANETDDAKTKHNFTYSLTFYGLFLIWPMFILLYEFILGIFFITSLKSSGMQWKKSLFGKLKIGEITSGLMRLPVGIMLFVFDNLSHISGLIFGISSLAWFIMASYTDNPHNYLESLSIVLISGWLHTINYVKGFKDWNALASILKQILIKDITCFIYIYIFVLISFGYAMHVLIQADYNLSMDSRQSTSTIYLTFYRMLSPGNILDISEASDYKNSGGRVYVLRAVCAAYSVLSTVVLMNLLIAMMNSTYSEIKSNKSTAWRIDSLKIALWMEKNLPCLFTKYVINFKTTYDPEQNRWFLAKETNLDKNDIFWEQTTSAVKENDEDKLGAEENQARENQKKIDREKSITTGLESLTTQLDDFRKELSDSVSDSRMVKSMVVEMRMEIKRIHELCLETCTLAKLNRRLDELPAKKQS